MISGGDIKAVQGTTGHASADMLVNTYAHIQQSSRVELGKKFESGFYAKSDTLQPAGCTRRRRTHHLYDSSFGIAEGCRPGNEGKAPLSSAHLMQKRALIAMQYSALHHRTWKTPTVQKPCRNRAAMAYKTKSHEIFRFHGIFWCDGRDAIDCIAVEDEYGNAPAQRAELDWLLYNKPLGMCRWCWKGDGSLSLPQLQPR